MKMFEYAQREVMKDQEESSRQFVARKILQEVKRIAKEKNIDEETAYWGYTHGLYSGDREI